VDEDLLGGCGWSVVVGSFAYRPGRRWRVGRAWNLPPVIGKVRAALSGGALTGVRHNFASIDGLRIHYAEAGEGDPLLLLHG
jgi:hypothetical protein